MRIYLAGTTVSAPQVDNPIAQLFRDRPKLHSYYHANHGFEAKWFKMNMKNGVDLFLDSGAYSAMTQGVHIDIDEYISFIKQHQDSISVYANLDVIKGADAAQRSYDNLKYMESKKLSPIPIFHSGEDEGFLCYYVANYDYIALGGLTTNVQGNQASKRAWLDRVFRQYICDDDGWPKVKVHGFALTTLRDMLRWPWYSVDSTSWVMTSRVGSIYVPRQRAGAFTYDDRAWIVSVTSRDSSDPRHYRNLGPRLQRLVTDYLTHLGYSMGRSSFRQVQPSYKPVEGEEKWAGKELDAKGRRRLEVIEEPGVCNDYRYRDQVNILYFQHLQDQFPPWPTRFDRGGRAASGEGFGL